MTMEKVAAMYDAEDWGKLAKAAGFVPLNTESSAREAFRFCAGIIKQLANALQEASGHLDYCGYGDSWERECAGDLSKTIAAALEVNPLREE